MTTLAFRFAAYKLFLSMQLCLPSGMTGEIKAQRKYVNHCATKSERGWQICIFRQLFTKEYQCKLFAGTSGNAERWNNRSYYAKHNSASHVQSVNTFPMKVARTSSKCLVAKELWPGITLRSIRNDLQFHTLEYISWFFHKGLNKSIKTVQFIKTSKYLTFPDCY